MTNQSDLILEFMQKNGSINPKQAEHPPICSMRLAARIEELKKKGHNIDKTQKNGNNYATYFLISNESDFKIGVKPKRTFKQHKVLCKCGKSFYSIDLRCNKCSRERK